MRDAPTVSIVLVTHERPRAATEALASIRANAGGDYEVIVVDNGSREPLDPSCLEGFAASTELLRLTTNVGCPAARNRAYERCRGVVIVNVDDDGMLGPYVVNTAVEIFQRAADVGIVTFRQVETMAEARRVERTGTERTVSAFNGGLCAMRRSMLETTGGYPDGHFLFAEEEHLALRALDSGYRIVRRDDVCMVHPRLGGSVSSSHDLLRYRNALANVVELFPLSLVLPCLAIRALRLLWIARKRRTVASWWLALREVVVGLPQRWARRRPCRVRTVLRFFSLR